MNGDGVGKDELIPFGPAIGDTVAFVVDEEGLFFFGDGFDAAEIAIEDFFFIVIADLHDFVAFAENGAEDFFLFFAASGGIESGLEAIVEGIYAGRATIHGDEDLNILMGIEAKFVGNAIEHEIFDPIGGLFGRVGRKTEEVFTFFFKMRLFPFVDIVGIDDDVGIFGLAID